MPAIAKDGDKKLYPLGGIKTLPIIINKIIDRTEAIFLNLINSIFI